MIDDIEVPERVYLLLCESGFLGADPVPSEEESRTAAFVFVHKDEARLFNDENAAGCELFETTWENFIESLRDSVREQLLEDGFIWLIDGDDFFGIDLLDSFPVEDGDLCRYCAQDLTTADMDTLEEPFIGCTIKGRSVQAQVNILFKQCPSCGRGKFIAIKFPFDPDEKASMRLLRKRDSKNE